MNDEIRFQDARQRVLSQLTDAELADAIDANLLARLELAGDNVAAIAREAFRRFKANARTPGETQ
jgi:hypothetical protein